jgi:hypothetical protein
MPLCRTGRHNWYKRDDAAKCCHPEWKRVLVIGSAVPLRTHAGAVGEEASMRTCGHTWQRANACSPGVDSLAPMAVPASPVFSHTSAPPPSSASSTTPPARESPAALIEVLRREDRSIFARLGLCPRCFRWGLHDCRGPALSGA